MSVVIGRVVPNIYGSVSVDCSVELDEDAIRALVQITRSNHSTSLEKKTIEKILSLIEED